MVKKVHTSGHPESRKRLTVKLSEYDDLIKEVKVQKKEHPWLPNYQLYRLSQDHIRLKHKGLISHG